jgi:hypothetical protein
MTASKLGSSGTKPRVIKYERKRLALLGNQRAVKHGRYTAAAKAARQARLEAAREAWREQERRSNEWIRSQPGYRIDYHAICQTLINLGREKEAAERAAMGTI